MEYDRATLTSILTGLGYVTEARAVALWTQAEGELQLVVDWQLGHELVDLLRRAWPACRWELRAGRRYQPQPDVLLLPLQPPGGPLLGVLHYVGTLPIESAKQFVLDDAVEDFVRILTLGQSFDERTCHRGPAARSLKAMLTVDIDGDVDHVKRRAYRRFVTRCGGDASIAAHTLGIARSVFYSRLNACGIFSLKRRPRGDHADED